MDYSMESIQWGMSLWMFVCAFAGTIYGIIHFILPRKALYLTMVAFGIGCQMFAMLFSVIYIAAQGWIRPGFHVGLLGILGSLRFFLAANYGQMDSLVDDGTKKFLRVRLIALAGPILFVLLYLWFFFSVQDLEMRIVMGMVTFFAQSSIYYNFKHVIIYDVENGIISSVKAYNVLACIYEILTMLEIMSYFMGLKVLYVVSCTLIGVVSLLILPALKKGAERWIMEF